MAVCVLLAALANCTTSGAFFVDERLEITQPQDRRTVTLPLTVRWTVNDFTVTGPDGERRTDAGYFGLFVDRDPMGPAEDLRSLVDEDETCDPPDDCITKAYLSERGVYTTQKLSHTFTSLGAGRDRGRSDKDRHELTIVLLNGAGERIGESGFFVSFSTQRAEGDTG